MGCDIHCYIEYQQDDCWSDFGGRINPGRNYWMFGTLAGVRRDDFPHIEPRGVPADLARAAFGDWTIYVNSYSKAHAEESVAKGYCQWVERNGKNLWVTNSDWHGASWLTTDEFELAIAVYLKQCGFQINVLELPAPSELAAVAVHGSDIQSSLTFITEYWAILQAMRCFEAQGCPSRLVFWFDN